MRIGVLAKADNSGLGIQSWEVARHLDASVLVIRDQGRERKGFPYLDERYPDALVVDWDTQTGRLPHDDIADWLTTVDVVYAPETLFDWRMAMWAREIGTATVVHVNPEFYRHGHDFNLARPTEWWSATTWRREHLDPSTITMPMPVAAERFAPVEQHDDYRLRVLHIAGHVAARDRNGTRNVLDALRSMPSEVSITIRCQDRRLPHHPQLRSRRLTVEQGGVEHYWDGWDGYDALLLPRRYGGLCLPAGEGCAAGLALAMTALSPNETWPHVPMSSKRTNRPFRAPGGVIDVYHTKPPEIVAALRHLCQPEERHRQQEASRAWAAAHSWDALRSMWLDQLEAAADVASVMR
jgi:hypothetical protein